MTVKYAIFLFALMFQIFHLQNCVSLVNSQESKTVCRERKEFTSMSISERIRFVNIFKMVSTNPAFSPHYRQLVQQHPKLFYIVHEDKQFFPWHRNYLLKMENLLRLADPDVTLPYWDWSLRSTFPWRNAVLDIWTSFPWGLGGNGSHGNLCVATGPFAPSQWRTAKNISDYGCLQRNFSGVPPGIMAVHRALRFLPSQFHKFHYYISEFLHNALHVRVGGTLAQKEASFAPEFFLHHAFLDKIWSDYQKQSSEHKWVYFGASNYTLYNTTIKAYRMVDNNDLLGLGVRVCYKDPFENYRNIHERLRKYSVKRIKSFINDEAFEYPFQDFHEF